MKREKPSICRISGAFCLLSFRRRQLPERVPDTVIRALVKETVDSLIDSLQNVDDESGEIRKFVKSSQSAKMISSMETLTKLDSRIAVSNKALNANPDLFALRNAVINLRTGEVLEPDPKTRITRYADYDYDPEAECPLWMEQLRQVFKNDMAVVDFFMRTLAYTLLGNPVESKILLPFGTGANGKSTVMNVVRALFGQYGCMAQAEVFMVRGGNNSASAPGEALLRMEGARFVYAMEPPEDGVLRESFIKAATGGEPIVARPMYGKHSIEYKPVFVIWMPTNYKPIVKGDNIATWRRLILIPFTACFEGEDKDPHRLEKLLKELPGILNLLIRKYIPQYLKNGLDIPPQIKAATEEYKDDMDLTGSFIAECCELDPTYYVSTQDLFNAWTQWSTSSGEFGYISSARKLGRVLAAKGFTQVKHLPGANSTRGFYGLRLRARDISEF